MEQLFKESSQKILIYTSVETVEDPEDLNVSHEVLNSLPIDAIVTDISGSSMSYKTQGIITTNSIEIIFEKKHRPLLELSYKITVNSIDYKGFKVNGQMNIRNLDIKYCRLYIHREK